MKSFNFFVKAIAFLAVVMFGTSQASAVEAVSEMQEGYYFIKNASSNDLMCFDSSNAEAWRIHHTGHEVTDVPGEADAYFIFKVVEVEGGWALQNFGLARASAEQTYVGDNGTSGRGEGLGWVVEPLAYDFDYNAETETWGIKHQTKTFSGGGSLQSQGGGVLGYWGTGNTGGNGWTFYKISEEQMGNFDYNTKITEALAKAKLMAKEVFRYDIDTENALITNAEDDDEGNQFWGSQEPGAKDSYSNYRNLIDGDLSTCFQSTWSSGVAAPPQPFQVDLKNNPVQDFQFYFGLRTSNWGIVEQWSDVTIYATNDETVAAQGANLEGDGAFDVTQWDYITHLDASNFPTTADWSGVDESTRSFTVNVTGAATQKYRFFRFLVNSTLTPQDNMMYTIGEFQMYEAKLNEAESSYTTIDGMKAAIDALKEEITKAETALGEGKADESTLNNLTKAMEAVIALSSKGIEDGYYKINLAGYKNATLFMAPMNVEDNWKLGAIEYQEGQNEFIWYVEKQEDGSYKLQNLGEQDLTYINTFAKGANAGSVIMGGQQDSQTFTFTYRTDGSVYMVSDDCDYNLAVGSDDQTVETAEAQNVKSAWKFIKVGAEEVPANAVLARAIADVNGYGFEEGEEVGQLSSEAMEAIEGAKATAEGASSDFQKAADDLHTALAKAVAAQNPLEEGYYRFLSIGRDDANYYLAPVEKSGTWYLGNSNLDEYDTSTIWHVLKTDSGFVMKNCGTQALTYVAASGSKAKMASTPGGTLVLNQVASNIFMIGSSDTDLVYLAGTDDYVSTNTKYSANAKWYIYKVSEEETGIYLSLQEAITNAAGVPAALNLGPSPGQNKGDATALNAVLDEAREMVANAEANAEAVDAMKKKIADELAKFNEQDHGIRGVEEGIYYFESAYSKFYTSYNKHEYICVDLQDVMKYEKPAQLTESAKFFFYVTPLENGNFTIKSIVTDKYFGEKGSDNQIHLTTEPEVEQTITRIEGTQYKLGNVVNGTSSYLMGNEMGGQTDGGAIILGTAAKDGTGSWWLTKLDEAFADSILGIAAKEKIYNNLYSEYNKAVTISSGLYKYIESEEGLITEADDSGDREVCQFYATWQNDTYSSYSSLIDGIICAGSSSQKIFQSSWSITQDQQFFQVDLRENPVQDFKFYYGLRDGSWGYKEQWSDVTLYATNDEEIAYQSASEFNAEDWDYIDHLTSFPTDLSRDGSNRSFTYIVKGVAKKKYQWYRFKVNKTIEQQLPSGMYCLAEFQMYEITLDEENSPYAYIEGMKDAGDALLALINEYKPIIDKEDGAAEPTAEMAEKIKKAADAVKALTPSTEEIDALINEATEYSQLFGTEAEDGVFGDVTENDMEALNNAIKYAEGYDQDRPLMSDINPRIDSLKKALEDFKNAQVGPEANKWYYIENTDQAREAQTGECGGRLMYAPNGNSREARGAKSAADAISWGLYDEENGGYAENAESNPYAMWRLVPVDGGGFAIQNRGTGMYIDAMTNHNGYGGQTWTPQPYKIGFLKSGQVKFTAMSGDNDKPLHADAKGYVVSWEGTYDSPSSWTMKSAEEAEMAIISLPYNSISIKCMPYPIGGEDYAELNTDEGVETYAVKAMPDANTLELVKKQSFEAGEPFIVVAGDYTGTNEENEQALFCFPLPTSFTQEAKAANGLYGLLDFAFSPVPGLGYFKDNALVATQKSTTFNGQTGYIQPKDIIAAEGEADLIITTEATIDKADFVKVGKIASDNIFSLDGKLMKANASDASGLEKGVYIFKNKKYLVK